MTSSSNIGEITRDPDRLVKASYILALVGLFGLGFIVFFPFFLSESFLSSGWLDPLWYSSTGLFGVLVLASTIIGFISLIQASRENSSKGITYSLIAIGIGIFFSLVYGFAALAYLHVSLTSHI